jgi:hypothetical protein
MNLDPPGSAMQIDACREELAHRHFANPVLVQDVKTVLRAWDELCDGGGEMRVSVLKGSMREHHSSAY